MGLVEFLIRSSKLHDAGRDDVGGCPEDAASEREEEEEEEDVLATLFLGDASRALKVRLDSF